MIHQYKIPCVVKSGAALDRQIVEDARILQWCMNHSEEFIKVPHECSSSFFVLAACTFFGQLPGLSKPNSFENKVSNMAIIIQHLENVCVRDLSHIDPASVVNQEKEHVSELLRVFLEIVCPPQHKIHTWRSNVVPPQVSCLDEQFLQLEALISELEASAVPRVSSKADSKTVHYAIPVGKLNENHRCTGLATHSGNPALDEDTIHHSRVPLCIPSAKHDALLSRHTRARIQRFTQQEAQAWRCLLQRHHCKEELKDYKDHQKYTQDECRALLNLIHSAAQMEKMDIERKEQENERTRLQFDAALCEVHAFKENLHKDLRRKAGERRKLYDQERREIIHRYQKVYQNSMHMCRSATEKHMARTGDRYT